MVDNALLIKLVECLTRPKCLFSPICDNIEMLRERMDSPLVHPIYDPATGGIKKVIFNVPQNDDDRLFLRLNTEAIAESTSDDAQIVPDTSDLLQSQLKKLHAVSQRLDVLLRQLPRELLGLLDAHCGRPWRPLVSETVADAILFLPQVANNAPTTVTSGRKSTIPLGGIRQVPNRVRDALEFAERVDLAQHWTVVTRAIDQRVGEIQAIRREIAKERVPEEPVQPQELTSQTIAQIGTTLWNRNQLGLRLQNMFRQAGYAEHRISKTLVRFVQKYVSASEIDSLTPERLEVIVDCWLDKNPATGSNQASPVDATIHEASSATSALAKQEAETPFHVNVDLSQIRIEGKSHDVQPEAARMAKLLLDNDGEWVSMRKHEFTKPSETKKQLPNAVLNLVETAKGKGYRLRPRR